MAAVLGGQELLIWTRTKLEPSTVIRGGVAVSFSPSGVNSFEVTPENSERYKKLVCREMMPFEFHTKKHNHGEATSGEILSIILRNNKGNIFDVF